MQESFRGALLCQGVRKSSPPGKARGIRRQDTLARIEQAVAAVRSLKLGLVADQEDRNADPTSGGSFTANSDDPDYPNCWSNASATIVTYDPVPIMVTYTTSFTHWYYPGNGSYISTGGGECWANPDSEAGTT